jgi:ATP-binding cassette subfamily C protein LapB
MPPSDTSHASIDFELATQLSRLAASQGVAIPVHRFDMMSTTAGGGDLVHMNRTQRALSMWQTALPDGEAKFSDEPPDNKTLPSIWLSEQQDQVCLLRGRLVHGGYSCENADGSLTELSATQAAKGVHLHLRTMADVTEMEEHTPTTAREWFFHALRKRRLVFLEAIAATFLVSVLALVTGLYSMQVYDRVIPTQGYSTLLVLTTGAVIALLLELLVSYVRSRMIDHASKAIDQELSGVFFNRMLNIRMDARPKSIGTFAGQLRQFELVRNFMTASTLFLLADAPFALFFIWVIYFIGGNIALVPLVLLPVAVLAGFYAKWRVAKLSREQLQDANRKNGVLIEAIDGIEAIKAAGGEWKMLDRWQQITAETSTRELRMRSATALAGTLSQGIQRAAYVGLIGAGAFAINAGEITQGALIACTMISNRALGPITQIAGMFVQWQQASAALLDLDEMMKLPQDQEPGTRAVIPSSCQGEIRLEAATFTYSDQRPALQATSLAIRPGQRVAVIGPAGSGKSTLIKLMSGLYKPTEGRVFLDGVDMSHIAPAFLREQIGYLTQDVRLFNGTLRDNLSLGLPSPTDSQLLSAASRTGLDRLIQSHPKGMDLSISEGGRGLSGGQRQLVGLTRLLLAKPKILLLDEPTASMDGELEALVMKHLFDDALPDTVVVLVTHKRSLLDLVDHVIAVDKGRVLLSEPRASAMEKLARRQRPPSAPPEISATPSAT